MILLLAMLAMWVWIYLFAPRTNPDRLQSRSFAQAAEAVCAPLQAAINALPSGRDVDTVAARNAQIIAGTELAEAMVMGLRESAPLHLSDVGDQRLVDAWFADWDAYLQDRRNHTDKLSALGERASDNDLRFILSQRAEGGIYTRRIDGFANVNDMASCHTPLDI
ncbi:MAG: hypothetical protein KTU85_11595 [Acidimicrobiia bacterium]|nr:hypothetical protein [Acidimicrobiia bacterium]MCY4457808.1 hypothetical protein [Acidimicrobiaceae bacterium]